MKNLLNKIKTKSNGISRARKEAIFKASKQEVRYKRDLTHVGGGKRVKLGSAKSLYYSTTYDW